jgi:hypothetical protein
VAEEATGDFDSRSARASLRVWVSFWTTKLMKSVMVILKERAYRVDHWRTSEQSCTGVDQHC